MPTNLLTRRTMILAALGLGGMMSFRADDLTDLFLPAPAGPAQNMTYRQGTVLEFNQVTLENRVDVGGSILQDLPILGVAEAATLTPGSSVGIMVTGDAAKSYAIIGRFVRPGTAEATKAMSTLALGVQTAFVSDFAARAAGGFGDLTASPGPSISNVFVKASGTLLVAMSAFVNIIGDLSADRQGRMAVQLTGATSVGPDDNTGYLWFTTAVVDNDVLGIQASQIVIITGLNSGIHTITAKYETTGTLSQTSYGLRRITVLPL